jgi:tRNA A-37 threonylcarbamoyl transferase component Bud32
MAEPKIKLESQSPKQGVAAMGGGTMIASSSASPPPAAGKRPPPPPPLGAKATVIASAPPASANAGPAPAPAPKDDVGNGGTMIASSDAGVPAPITTQNTSGVVGDLVGTLLLGRYRVIKKLGEGGMGTVYLGEHATIGKKFAVKVLSYEYAHKEDLRDRFLQEARAASMISQENVVEITDFGDTPDGSVFFIMEFLQGEDLSDTLKSEGRLPWSRAKPIMLQICRALAAAHDAGIIHRDMKPENCYRIARGSNEDFIKVLDFGIAKVTSADEGEGKGLTRTGMIFGTPEYMSPEQAQGARPDHRVDVYAVGVILYELLTGEVPFSADTFMGILTKHMFEVPRAPSSLVPDADIPLEVENIILKAMQKDRELRFANMREMAEAIEAVGTGAAAVHVVSENIARPSTGEMSFTGSRATTVPGAPGTMPPVAATYEEPRKSNKGLIFGIVGGLALVAAGIGAFLAFGGDETPVAENTNDATVAAPPEKQVPETPEVVVPAEPEKVKEIAVGTETVNYKITTKDPEGNLVEASIVDIRDNGSYGKTNTAEGIEVEKSSEAMELVLRATGFEPMPIKIIPVQDKLFDYELQPAKKATVPKTPIKKTTPKKTTPDPEPPPETPTKEEKKPPRRVSPDLKDPFGARQK